MLRLAQCEEAERVDPEQSRVAADLGLSDEEHRAIAGDESEVLGLCVDREATKHMGLERTMRTRTWRFFQGQQNREQCREFIRQRLVHHAKVRVTRRKRLEERARAGRDALAAAEAAGRGYPAIGSLRVPPLLQGPRPLAAPPST